MMSMNVVPVVGAAATASLLLEAAGITAVCYSLVNLKLSL